MKKDASFVVRLPREDLEKLNELVKKNATNRSELFRQWVKKYIEENKFKEENNMTLKVGQKFIDQHGREMELVEINPEFEEKYVMSYKYEGDWVVAEFTEEEVREMKKA